MSPKAKKPVVPQICFLMGILHPQVTGPGPIWEDYLIHESELLREFTDRLYTRWNKKWDIPNKVAPQDAMLTRFGEALQEFLHLQVRPPDALAPAKKAKVMPRIRLTKTPSVKGLENFTALFPDAKLIILVRDGRAVVESGVRSFGWKYDEAARQWAQAAKTILEFRAACPNVDRRMLLVRYEDLVQSESQELRRVFAFLDLDAALYDFEVASSLNVLGSSEIRKQGEEVHWRGTEKKEEFRPLERFSHWDARKHQSYWKIAGRYAQGLGYSAEPGTDGGKD